jgi:hypothetical protein
LVSASFSCINFTISNPLYVYVKSHVLLLFLKDKGSPQNMLLEETCNNIDVETLNPYTLGYELHWSMEYRI